MNFKKILRKTLISAVVMGLTYSASLVYRLTNPLDESEDRINVVALYSSKEADPLGGFDGFEENFKDIMKRMEKKEKKPVNYEIKRISPATTTFYKDGEISSDDLDLSDIKEEIDESLTHFARKYGQIDLAVLGFHSTPKSSSLSTWNARFEVCTKEKKHWDCENTKYVSRSFMEGIDVLDVEYIASKNPLARHIFSNNARVLYMGCSAGRGKNSIAETFNKHYGVSTFAPDGVYSGDIMWNGEQVVLSSKDNIRPDESRVTSYLGPDGDVYLWFGNGPLFNKSKNKDTSLENLIAKKQIESEKNNDSLMIILKDLDFAVLESDKPISHFMDINYFRKPSLMENLVYEIENDFKKVYDFLQDEGWL